MSNVNFLLGHTFLIFLSKITFLTVDFLFIVFAIVVLRQILSMNTVINDSNDAFILKMASSTLLIIAVSLFLTGLVIL